MAKCNCDKFDEYWGTSKLIITFGISQGRYVGTQLECFFNLDRKMNQDGEYILAPKKRGAYIRRMRSLFKNNCEQGGDWLTPENLLGQQFKIEVETITKNYAKEALECCNQYSKVKPSFKLLNDPISIT